MLQADFVLPDFWVTSHRHQLLKQRTKSSKEFLILILPRRNVSADVLDRNVLGLEQPPLVEREDEERDLSRPHSGEMIGHLVFAFLLGTACLQFENRVLWYQSPAGASVDVVDRQSGLRFVVVVFTWAGRVVLVLVSLLQLVFEVAICFKSDEEFKAGKLI